MFNILAAIPNGTLGRRGHEADDASVAVVPGTLHLVEAKARLVPFPADQEAC